MTGKELPGSSPYADDDGTASPELLAALDRFAAEGAGALPELVGVLENVRVLVPVLAEAVVVDEVDGLQVDREASTGVVAIAAPDGRQVLPVFSSVATMAAWRTDARPVPVQARQAAGSAVTEGWELLVIDPGGPVVVQVPRTAVWALARSESWRPAVVPSAGGELGVDPEVGAVLVAAALGVDGVRAAEALPGQRAEVALRLGLDAGLDRAGLDAVLAQVNRNLAGAALVAERVDSLELRVHAV